MDTSDIRTCKYGQYNLGESKELQLSNVDSTACRDIIISRDYNYVLFKNELRVQGKNGEVIGTLSGLGNTVHMCLVNEKTLAITARENDVYLVDVSDVANPTEWIWKQEFHRTVSIYSFAVDIMAWRLLTYQTLINQ